LSTLTKVLIVLLTVFSIFLCGIVVTYVANAENQRERADNLQRNIQSAKASQAAAVEEMETAKKAVEALKAELNAQITDLDAKNKELIAQMDDIKRQNTVLMAESQQQRASATMATVFANKQTEMFKAAQT